MTYTLFIGNKRYSSWSMRPWVLLKALNIPFDERLFFFNDGIAQPQFKAFSPSSKVPCLHVKPTAAGNNDDPLVVWDSLAIIEHIADDHPAVWPGKDKPAARAFARSAAAEMHSGFSTLRNELNMNVGLRFERQTPSEALQKDLDRISALFKHGLETFGGPWLAGETFTGADAFYAPVATRLKTYGLELGDEKAQEYVERLFECAAVREWVYDGIRETAREPMHEEECRQGRKLVADLSAEASQ